MKCIAIGLMALTLNASDWTPKQTAYELAFVGAMACDWLQTRNLIKDQDPKKLCETNMLLGPYPQMNTVNQYFIFCTLTHLAISVCLPTECRLGWQRFTLVLEMGIVGNNARIGLKMKW